MIPEHHLPILMNMPVADAAVRRFSRKYPQYADDFRGEAYLALVEYFKNGGVDDPRQIYGAVRHKLIDMLYAMDIVPVNFRAGVTRYSYVDVDECWDVSDPTQTVGQDTVETVFVVWGLDAPEQSVCWCLWGGYDLQETARMIKKSLRWVKYRLADIKEKAGRTEAGRMFLERRMRPHGSKA